MDISEKIRQFRVKKGLSQEELAEQIGVSRQSVSKWESGQAAPEIGKLLKLANEFGITTDELLDPEVTEFGKDNDNDKSDETQSGQSHQSLYDRKKYARGYRIGRDILFCSVIIIIAGILLTVGSILLSTYLNSAITMLLPLLINAILIGIVVGLIIMLYNKSKLKQIHFDGVDSSKWDTDVRNEKGKIKMSKAARIVTAVLLILMLIPVIASIIL